MVNVIACRTPANYGFTQSSKTMEFEVNTGNAENRNDSFFKLIFTVEGMSDGDPAFLDGKIVSFINKAQVKQKNGTVLEDLEQVNRYQLSNDIQTASPENCKYGLDNWKDNLVKKDSDTAGAAGNCNKRHIHQGTSYVGILPVSDVFNFFKGNPLWHPYRSEGLEYKLWLGKLFIDLNLTNLNHFF